MTRATISSEVVGVALWLFLAVVVVGGLVAVAWIASDASDSPTEDWTARSGEQGGGQLARLREMLRKPL